MHTPSIAAGTPAEPGYNYDIVRKFTVMALVWGALGMLVGVILAAQLVWPALNFDLPWFSFGRIRPVHTNLVIFAFGGGALFATSFYVVQRTSRARLISDGADRKSTRLNSSHVRISYAVFCLKKKNYEREGVGAHGEVIAHDVELC